MLRRKFIPLLAEDPRYFFGGGGSDSDVTSRVEPWDDAKPYYVELYAIGHDAFTATSRDPFTGEFLAGANTYDTLARSAIDLTTTNMADDAVKLRNHAVELLRGDWLDPSSNPWIAASVEASLSDLKRRFTDDVLPTIIDLTIQNGAYSGTAREVLEARAMVDFDREGAKVASAIYYEAYTRERVLMENAPQLFAVAESVDGKRATLIQANADAVRGLAQIADNEAWQEFQETLAAPWRGAAEFSALLTGGGFNSQTTHDPSKQDNKFANLFQGALGGAATGFQLGGPVGGAIGGLVGGIGSLLG